MVQGKGWLSPAQAARELGVSPDRVRQMTKKGTLPATMTPLGRLIPASSVKALAEVRRGGRDNGEAE